MDKILDFLDFSSIDPQMYWRIASRDGLKTFEISWRRETSIHWRYREYEALFWTLTTRENLLQALDGEGADLQLFEQAVKGSLMHQVCFADRIVKDSQNLLGSDHISAGIKDHEEFLKSISTLVGTMIPKESAPRLRVVKD